MDIISFVIHPWKIICYLNQTKLRKLLTDRLVITCQFRNVFGRKLDLKNPSTYNEKLQWAKLYDRNPQYRKLVDKFEVKEIVAKKIGKQHIIPTYGVWDSPDAIDFESLPDSFVLKSTHDSHSTIICTSKKQFDKEKAKHELGLSLKRDYFYGGREWPYKRLQPRIIAEKYMVDNTFHELRDYKFFCFNGEPKAMYIATDRYNPEKPTAFDFFDMQFTHLPIIQGHPNADTVPEKPANFEKMKEMARILSKGMMHVRVDFYDINGEVYFGELTFYHFSGFVPFQPESWDYTFGEWMELPQM